MGGFSTMNTAISGLMASQRALDVVGQNVVNANTPGYSRQRVQVSSVAGAPSSNFHTGSSQAVLGGVKIDTIERVRDVFLENTRVAAGASMEAIKAQTNALEGAEQLLSEPGDGGLQSVVDDFYNAWHDLAQKPTDPGAGAVVIQSGRTVNAKKARLGMATCSQNPRISKWGNRAIMGTPRSSKCATAAATVSGA